MHPSRNLRRRFLGMAAGTAAALALPLTARAQAYPCSPIRIIVGFPPGGGADAFARLLAPYLSEKLGQPIAVENKTGANGNVATDFVSKSKPDGYTLLLSTSSAVVAAPHAFPNMPAHPQRDLTPISMAVESEFVLITNPSLEAKTYKDFIALAQKSPGKLIHASPGIGSANHIAAELLSLRAGIKTVLLPDKNRKDLLEVPDEIKKELEFKFMGRMEEVLQAAFGLDEMNEVRRKLALKRQTDGAVKPAAPSLQA